jgi:putative membrane protein
MELIIKILIGLVAFIHLYILWFEMFAWETRGKKVFKNFPDSLFSQTKEMAANQGLYNGFLAAGLIWSIIFKNTEFAAFFLVCVIIAGIYGAYSTKKIRLFYIQSVPAIIALILTLYKF